MIDPIIGRTLAHYRIEHRLGSGGMGVVYAARDLRLDRRVAVKILTETDDAGCQSLMHEARAASGLSHPHIAAIHAVEEAEGVAFIVMEFVEGEPLSVMLARRPLDGQALVRYGIQIADADAHDIASSTTRYRARRSPTSTSARAGTTRRLPSASVSGSKAAGDPIS